MLLLVYPDMGSMFAQEIFMKSVFPAEYETCLKVLVASRKKAGLTQQELADELRKPQSFVAKYENGQRRIDIAEFLMIMRLMNVLPSAAIDLITKKARNISVRHRSRRLFFARKSNRTK